MGKKAVFFLEWSVFSGIINHFAPSVKRKKKGSYKPEKVSKTRKACVKHAFVSKESEKIKPQ